VTGTGGSQSTRGEEPRPEPVPAPPADEADERTGGDRSAGDRVDEPGTPPPSAMTDPADAILGSAEAALARGVDARPSCTRRLRSRSTPNGAPARTSGAQPAPARSGRLAFLKLSDQFLAAQGFTEHGFRHANLVGRIAYNVLHHLGADERAVRARRHRRLPPRRRQRRHPRQPRPVLGVDRLRRAAPTRGRPYRIGLVLSAVGNHEEQYGSPRSAPSARR
jgi:uncharacterized protein